MKNENKIESILEGFDLKPEQIDEIMIQLSDAQKNVNTRMNQIIDNQEQIMRDTLIRDYPVDKDQPVIDWRDRARLAAAIISKSLE